MKSNLLREKRVVVLCLLFFSFTFSSVGYAEEKPVLAFDSSGTMVIIPLDNTAIAAAKEFVQQVQTSNVVHVSAMVYAPPGVAAKLVLAGNQSDLQQAVKLYQQLLSSQTNGHLVVIAASLRELTKATSSDIGINPIPTVGGTFTVKSGVFSPEKIHVQEESHIKNAGGLV